MRRQTAIHPTTVMLPVHFNMTDNLFVQVMHPEAARPTMDTALPPLLCMIRHKVWCSCVWKLRVVKWIQFLKACNTTCSENIPNAIAGLAVQGSNTNQQ